MPSGPSTRPLGAELDSTVLVRRSCIPLRMSARRPPRPAGTSGKVEVFAVAALGAGGAMLGGGGRVEAGGAMLGGGGRVEVVVGGGGGGRED